MNQNIDPKSPKSESSVTFFFNFIELCLLPISFGNFSFVHSFIYSTFTEHFLCTGDIAVNKRDKVFHSNLRVRRDINTVVLHRNKYFPSNLE